MKHLRVLVLVHEDYVPPGDVSRLSDAQQYDMKTELDVVDALHKLGHQVRVLGVREELRPIRQLIDEWQPDVAFNLLEEFQGEAVFDQNVVSYLEVLRVPYTGCSPRGLVLARDKALSKKLLVYHRIRCPQFVVARRGRKVRRPKSLGYPIIVKSLIEEASRGISRASVVRDDDELQSRVEFVHKRVATDAILEQFISGRELYVSVLGNARLTALPPRELVVKNPSSNGDLIATERLKHDIAYQEKLGADVVTPRKLPQGVADQLGHLSKRIYRILGLEGYGRIDYRLDETGQIYFLEANPNPEIARYEELATAAEAAGLDYESLIQRVLNLALRRSAG
jgi:D-alanine-D-alanine ligase